MKTGHRGEGTQTEASMFFAQTNFLSPMLSTFNYGATHVQWPCLTSCFDQGDYLETCL